jgi:hypothetical protein
MTLDICTVVWLQNLVLSGQMVLKIVCLQKDLIFLLSSRNFWLFGPENVEKSWQHCISESNILEAYLFRPRSKTYVYL